MKIYLIGPTFPFRGGISHYTTLLFRTFKKTCDVTLCAVKRQYPMWLYPGETDKDLSKAKLEEEGVNYLLDSMNPFTWFKIILDIKKQKPDMVIIPWWVSFWTVQYWVICTGIRFFKLSKILFVCHNVVEHESSRFGQFCTRLVLRKGDFFIAHSNEVKDSLLFLVPKANVKVKAHPAYDFFQTGDIDSETARQNLGFAPEHIVLLFFGFIRKYKGVPWLLDALKELADQAPNIRLLLAGEAWHEEENTIQNKINQHGLQNIVVRKNQYITNEDVAQYFLAADIAVFPYNSATASGALQIAYSFKKPVIASELSCFVEIVKDGETGFLTIPQNPASIAAAVNKFLVNGQLNTELIKTMKANISLMEGSFGWDGMTEEMKSFLA